ncbi:MAG: peptidylprolyl isomerase, partial [Bacteroidota bacterium]
NLLLFCCLIFVLQACLPPPAEDLTDVSMDLDDSFVRDIYRLQDELKSDSLLLLLEHEDATARYWASRAFASVQSKDAVAALQPLLRDTAQEVRQMAAYALGQIGSSEAGEALVAAFDQQDATNPLNYYVLEAIGKSAAPSYLPLVSAVATYQKQDTYLLEGQTACIYHYMLRGKTAAEGTKRMLNLVSDREHLSRARLYAANYLFRGRNLGLDTLSADTVLSTTFSREEDARIRMALAIALGKTKSLLAQETLLNQYQIESNYRVKCNILRAFSNFDYKAVKPVVLAAVRDPNLHIASTAVNYLADYGSSREANNYRRLARDTTLHPQIQIGLLNACNARLPDYFVDYKNRVTTELRRRYENETDPYLKAQALRAMAHYPRMYNYIGTLDVSQAAKIVQTAKFEALEMICSDPDYAVSFQASTRRVTAAIGGFLLEGIKSGDAGQVAVAANALRTPERDFKTILADSLAVLESALSQLNLPKEIESYNALKETIAYFTGTSFVQTRPAFNHPMDWALVDQISESTRATIETEKGTITLRFFPNAAPATVANFVDLAQRNYFDGKNFHRVVSNFVIQGGCNRGDGYGSEDYSIRSEFPPMYYERAGMIGMASAGKHTEGTQFFITHSPTLHLNGKYTIFAEVVDGMTVVHDIQVGDKILGVVVN